MIRRNCEISKYDKVMMDRSLCKKVNKKFDEELKELNENVTDIDNCLNSRLKILKKIITSISKEQKSDESEDLDDSGETKVNTINISFNLTSYTACYL